MAGRVGRAAFLLRQRAILNRSDSRQQLASISVPTFVLCGRQDALTPLSAHEEMAAAIPDARRCIIESC